MQLTFPWFPKELSPNSRTHWAKLASVKKSYRTEWWAIGQEAKKQPLRDGKVHLIIDFYPPSKRHYDLDNCLASIKSGLDGLADALQVDDKRFTLTIALKEEVMGYIKVTINQGD